MLNKLVFATNTRNIFISQNLDNIKKKLHKIDHLCSNTMRKE